MPCIISTASITFKPVFPTFSLDNRGKKCMDNTWQSIIVKDLGPDIHIYNTHSNNRYFKYRNFITTNNLYNSAVLEIFNQATRLIQQCIDSEQHSFETGGDNLEFMIVIRCISPNDPKISYYIIDHARQNVKWLHDDTPRCYNMDTGARMRDCAEYWHHRSKFPVHRHCTPANREEVAELLDGILSSRDPNIDRAEIECYVRRLGSIPSALALTDHQTSILAEIHSEALKHSLPAFYSPSLKGKLYKSLLGLSMPRFVHNRTHAVPGATVSQIIQEHLRPANRPINHSRIHFENSPLGTPSPSSSNSS